MNKTALKLGSILAILLSAHAFAGYSTLEQSRSVMKFPEYTTATKRIVFGQAKLILSEMFVHQEVKLRDFGPSANPLPKLDALEKRLDTISDSDFHQSLTDTFQGLKDQHTLYYLPKPFACYESFLPFRFKYVGLGEGKKGYAVTSVHTKKEITDLLPKPFEVAEGDLVISYNGKPVDEAVRNWMPKTYGANSEAQFRLAQDDLRYYGHGIDHLPAEDTVEVEFQNAKGTRYKYKLPWITYTDDDCIKPVSNAKIQTTTMGSVAGETNEPILYWQINRRANGVFGYIELTSFNPEVLSNDETVVKIRDLLLNELKETDGLMIDLRENGGGQIPLAEKIVQLFSPKEVIPLQYILKNSEANYVYFSKGQAGDPYNALLETARKLGTPYTTAGSISAKEEINDLGQAYFKPVAVFVNSKCYSSCEVLAAQMQDHEVGTIFGEDLQTGGGGANYYTLNRLLEENFAQVNPAPWAKLPIGQDFQFAFRQAIRVGKNAGALIEDVGVKADKLSPMSRSDIFNSNNDQILVLEKFLASETDKYTSSIFFDSEDRHDLVQNKEGLITAEWTDTSTFEFKQNGKRIAKRDVELNSSSSIALPVNTSAISDGTLELYGSNNEVPFWRKIIRYRVIPEFKPVAMNESLIDKMSIYSVINSREFGWQRKGSELVIGSKAFYENSMETEASLFVSLPTTNSSLNYSVSVESEHKFDFFKVFVIVDGNKPILVQSLSGHVPEASYTVDLSTLAGKNVELRFVFKTDEGTTDKGVTLKNVELK